MAFQTGGEVKQGFQTGGEIDVPRQFQAEQQQQSKDNLLLFESLKGRFPSDRLPLETRERAPRGFQVVGTTEPNPRFKEEIARRRAFTELTKRGFTPEQIDLTFKSQKILGGPRIGRTAGGIGGAIAATALAGRFIPGPIDDAAILAALIAGGGAGIGGATGEAIQTGIEEKRLISNREALSAFANEAITEVGGRAVVRGGKFLLSPLIKKTVPEAAELVADFSKVGGQFSPSELDKRFTLRIGEAFSRGSFGAKEIFQEFEEKQGKAVIAFADNLIESIGEGIARQTPEEIGDIFAQGISRPGGRIFNILDDLVDPLYSQIDELGKGASVATGNLKKFALNHLATDKRLNGQFLSPVGKSKLEKIIGLNDKLSFSDMRTLRSSFLKDARKLARDVDQSQGIIKQLAGITDNAIFDPQAAKGLTEETLNLLRNTNALYKSAQQGIKSTFPESLAKRLLRSPSNVAKEVFPNNNPKAIRALRKSLVEPISGKPSAEGKVLWNQLRQSWLADAVDQATKEGVAKPKVFNRVLSKMGTKALKEMFPEGEISGNLKKIQNIFEVAGKVPPTGASLFSRGAQIGGLAMMYNSGKEGDFVGFTTGSLLAIGPLAFAKLATSPKGMKLLTAGFKLKPGASGLVPNAVRVVRLLREIDQKEAKRQRAFRKEIKVQESKLRERASFERRGLEAAAARKQGREAIERAARSGLRRVTESAGGKILRFRP